jgi:hypothetical protein
MSNQTKTYPPSILESLAHEPNENNTLEALNRITDGKSIYISSDEYGNATTLKEDLDRLIASKPTPEAIDEYLLTQMDNPDLDSVPGREMIYIVAGNYAEFEDYLAKKKAEYRRRKPEMRQNAKPFPLYAYVRNRYNLMGLNDVKGYYIGTAFQRKDITQIKEAIAYVKSKKPLERAKPLKTSMTAVPITNEDMENLYEK